MFSDLSVLPEYQNQRIEHDSSHPVIFILSFLYFSPAHYKILFDVSVEFKSLMRRQSGMSFLKQDLS